MNCFLLLSQLLNTTRLYVKKSNSFGTVGTIKFVQVILVRWKWRQHLTPMLCLLRNNMHGNTSKKTIAFIIVEFKVSHITLLHVSCIPKRLHLNSPCLNSDVLILNLCIYCFLYALPYRVLILFFCQVTCGWLNF